MKKIRFVIAGLLCLAALHAQDARLANLSTRAQAGTGANILTAGFVIGPGADKKVLIRAVGPSLSAFGLTGLLADPQLTLVNSSQVAVATNDNWGTPVGAGAADAATLTSTFSAVGAFNLTSGSRDSALLMTLSPGSYTAQVSGANGGTGIALVEVYEVGATTSKLINISTRAQVGTGTSVMIPGIVVTPGTGTRRFLVRAAGPALAAFGLSGALADPTITITNATGTTIYATNDDWGTPTGTSTTDATTMNAAFTIAGAFPFQSGSKDAAALVDLPAGNYGIQVSGVGGTSGLALVEVYDTTPAVPPTVTIAATKPNADESGSANGEFTITRTGDTSLPLTVNYGVGGSAVNGYDYVLLPGTITIPAGAASVKLPVLVNPDLQNEGTDTAIVTLVAGSYYTVGAQLSATVSITDSPATLYVATVRPTTAATGGSTASGTATILLAQSGTLAAVNVTFSNLSSAEVTAHLVIGATEDYVFNLPAGQVTGAQWYFTPTGTFTSTDLLNALKSGNISVRIDTAKYPSGEVKGTFIVGSGTQNFSAPAAPPTVSLTNVTANDAARFLTQATFGPTRAEIDALTGGSIDTWLTTQLAMPFTSHRTTVQQDQATFGGSSSFTNWNATFSGNRQSAWFKTALTAPDQLRQRVAFALSQHFVVSDVSLGDDSQAEPLANYYDILGNGAFGNFRTLLENVTLSPMMGLYLSSLRNSKADPTTGQTPDENYAREVMQLFTIGLNKLQPDGTLQLGTDGLPIATYNQTTITQMAKVFTGWSYPSTNVNAFRSAPRDYYNPMQNFASNHDTTVKDLSPVLATPLAAGQTGAQDLKLALDALAFHPNTGPFVARSLIQRLVTSNPSPGYIYRVGKVFSDNASAPNQLALVVRAILTDYEARSPTLVTTQSFGKLKEPLLRLTQVLRAFGTTPTSGRYIGFRTTVDANPINGTTPLPATAGQISTLNAAYRLDNVQNNFAQSALRSPTVFNFYHPDYVLPGPLASAGLVAPEFEITDDNWAINAPNFYRTVALTTVPTTGTNVAAAPYYLALNLTAEQALLNANNISGLLDHLNLVLCAGNMPAATKTRITTALAAMPSTATALEKTQTAVLLTLTSPASAVQK